MSEIHGHENFDPSWLDERFAFDSAARNEVVEETLLSFTGKKEQLTIVDIGSGTGSNAVYFFDKFPYQQQWYFLELDPLLLRYSLSRLGAIAAQRKMETDLDLNSLKVKGVTKKININTICDSFLEIDKLLDLKSVDVVTAGAVFDLLSVQQFEDFARLLHENGVALLSTLNYAGMSFSDDDPLNNHYVDLYEQHMVRDQEYGHSLGKEVTNVMTDFYDKNKINYHIGKSVWNIHEQARKMHNFLFGFMEKAMQDMIPDAFDFQQFEKWLTRKRELSKEEKLTIVVEHYDLFIID